MHFSNDVTLFECIFTDNYLVKQLRAAPQSKGINTNTQALKLVYLKNGYIPKYCAVSLHIEKQNAFHILYGSLTRPQITESRLSAKISAPARNDFCMDSFQMNVEETAVGQTHPEHAH